MTGIRGGREMPGVHRSEWEWPPVSHREDPQTSRDGEREVTSSGRRRTHAQLVEQAVQRHRDSTSSELAAILDGLTLYAVRRRLSDLRNAGVIEASGRRGKESTWRIVEGQREMF